MTVEARGPLGLGEPAPGLAARTTQRSITLATLAGREIVLVFTDALGGAPGAERLATCRTLLGSRTAADADLLLVSADAAEPPPEALCAPGLHGRVILDGDGRVAGGFGIDPPAGSAAVAFRLDRALRVIERRTVDRLDALVAVLEEWRRPPAPAVAPRRLAPHPPVLLLDKVFEPAFAAVLIRWFEAVGGVESGFMTRDGDRTRGRLDPRVKRRRDAFVTDPRLVDQCRKRLLRRLAPAIETAFQFRATRIERYLVARYDAADRGMFRAHRDNDTSATAHRRFAVSINLNDAYQGGDLRFPEFGGDHLYRPDPGSALVFSCSLLHEATPVTEGERYTFLTFLFGENDVATAERSRALLVDDGRGALGSGAAQSGPLPGGSNGSLRSA